jgi:antitoxin YefM
MIYSSVVKTTYSITSAQANLPKVVREAAKGLITITKRDEAVAYVVSRERMETLIETLEILGNPKAMKALKDAREGKTKYYPLESLDED